MVAMDKPNPLPDLTTIMQANAPTLRTLYHEIFHRAPPKWSRIDNLRGNLAWALQALQQGHAPHSLRQSLLNTTAKHQGSLPSVTYQPGTRLIREWQGHTYEVTILEKGYLWQGKTYRSLTAIAEVITGAHWSGQRFFGMKSGQTNVKT